MAQEVQTTLNYQAELNQTEWIWYQERKISDKMQVRDKTTSWWKGTSSWTWVIESGITKVTSWDSYESWGDVTYKVEWWDIILPFAWSYLVEIQPPLQSYSQTTYYYDIILFQDGQKVFKKKIAYSDHARIQVPLNLGKKSRITVGGQAYQTWANWYYGLKLTKL